MAVARFPVAHNADAAWLFTFSADARATMVRALDDVADSPAKIEVLFEDGVRKDCWFDGTDRVQDYPEATGQRALRPDPDEWETLCFEDVAAIHFY